MSLPLVAFTVLALAAPEGPSAPVILQSVDHILAPPSYEATIEMVAMRPDASERVYRYRTYKKGDDHLLLRFDAPRSLDGHAVLRGGEDLWRYIPSLKRAVRVSSRSDFEGGDFRNADVLRVHLARDYRAEKLSIEDGLHRLELVATSKEAAYDRAILYAEPGSHMPVRIEYLTAAGKKLRTLFCRSPKDFGGHLAPSVLEMQNEVARGRKTIMTIEALDPNVEVADTRFRVERMGR